MRNVLLGIILALCVVIGYSIGRETAKNGPQPAPPISADTLYLRDTFVAYKPVYLTERVTDTVKVPVVRADTMMVHDTMFVYLERKQVRWEDSLAVVYASGVEPRVDSVVHFRNDIVITKEIPVKVHPKFVIGLQAGYGASKDGLSPYVGIGVTYNVMSLFKQ